MKCFQQKFVRFYVNTVVTTIIVLFCNVTPYHVQELLLYHKRAYYSETLVDLSQATL